VNPEDVKAKAQRETDEKAAKEKEVLERWKTEVCARSNKIDPDGEQDWLSMWIGFAIGAGLPMEVATDYSFYIEKAFPLEATPNE
jgi:hypothetical protein